MSRFANAHILTNQSRPAVAPAMRNGSRLRGVRVRSQSGKPPSSFEETVGAVAQRQTKSRELPSNKMAGLLSVMPVTKRIQGKIIMWDSFSLFQLPTDIGLHVRSIIVVRSSRFKTETTQDANELQVNFLARLGVHGPDWSSQGQSC